MNDEHLRFCACAEWAAPVRDELLPRVLGDEGPGDDVLELGAGPGLVTDLRSGPPSPDAGPESRRLNPPGTVTFARPLRG